MSSSPVDPPNGEYGPLLTTALKLAMIQGLGRVELEPSHTDPGSSQQVTYFRITVILPSGDLSFYRTLQALCSCPYIRSSSGCTSRAKAAVQC